MCKHSKTLIAVTLALVMAFSMAIPAFATGPTLYANWEDDPYQFKDYELYFLAPEVSYDYSKIERIYSDGPVGKLPTLYRDGYDFIGWYTEQDGGTEVTEDTLFSELDSYTVLYAHWKPGTTDPNAVDSATMRGIQARKEFLYKYTTKTLNKVPTDLAPTPLPEDLNLDPLDYWEQIIPVPTYNDACVEKTTRPVEEVYQEMRQLVNELTAGLTTDSDKFAALERWEDRNVTYSTDNRTDNVYLVYERRYGACSEKADLLYFMATLAGVKAARLEGGNHASTAALDENGVWFGDTHSYAVGNPVATGAYYNDGQSYYCCDLETGEITRRWAIKGKNKPIDASTVHFVDVPEDAWYADAVKWAITWGITKGTSENTFSPNAPCTNDEILTFLYRAANDYKFKGRSLLFTPKNDWAVDALEWAYDKDMFRGAGLIALEYDEDDEDAPCTRVMAVYYIYRSFGQPSRSTEANFTDMDEYRDYWHEVSWAVEEGIVQGTSETTFSPDVVCDRATIVTLLYRAYKDSMPLS